MIGILCRHKLRLTYAWCMKRDAWCVLHDSTCTSKCDAWCVKVIFAEGATQCGSHVAFLHTGTWHLFLSKYQRFHIHSSCYAVPNVSNSLYSFNEVSYSAGCSSTRLISFSRYVSSITSLLYQLPKSSTNERRRLCNLRMGQHVVVPGSHARILGGTRENL